MNGRPMWWQLHKTRLEIFAHYLNVSLALDSIEFHLHQVKQDCVVRIEVDCDESWKFSQRSVPSPQSFTVHPIVYEPQFPHSQFKWLNREGWDRIKSEQGVDLLLLLDKHNRYLQMCIGNIFVYVPNEQCWYTPPGDLGILCGTMRQVVIQLLRGIKCILGADQ